MVLQTLSPTLVKIQVKKETFLLKETAVFRMFFAKVRYLPYFHEKHAKNSCFFKQKIPNFDT